MAESRQKHVKDALTRSLKEFWIKRGVAPESASVRINLDYNITSAPQRAGEIAKFCRLAFDMGMAGRDVVDLGCGFGMIGATLLLDHAIKSLTLVDHNPEYIAAAQVMLAAGGFSARAKAQQSALDDCQIPEESADVILLIDLFYTRSFNPEIVFPRCRRALRPGGVMVLRTTNRVTATDQAAGIDAANMLAPGWADRYASWRTKGASGYRNFAARAPADIAATLGGAGFGKLRLMATDGYRIPSSKTTHRRAAFLPYCYFGAQRTA